MSHNSSRARSPEKCVCVSQNSPALSSPTVTMSWPSSSAAPAPSSPPFVIGSIPLSLFLPLCARRGQGEVTASIKGNETTTHFVVFLAYDDHERRGSRRLGEHKRTQRERAERSRTAFNEFRKVRASLRSISPTRRPLSLSLLLLPSLAMNTGTLSIIRSICRSKNNCTLSG